eukprot:1157924-Pelagomonas_calceolata.AAC.13
MELCCDACSMRSACKSCSSGAWLRRRSWRAGKRRWTVMKPGMMQRSAECVFTGCACTGKAAVQPSKQSGMRGMCRSGSGALWLFLVIAG